jgi:phage FluMu protein Com
MTVLLKEIRCQNCSKLLARYRGHIEVKCPRCKKIQTANTMECLTEALHGEKNISEWPSDPALR